jgi:hypothetical protein
MGKSFVRRTNDVFVRRDLLLFHTADSTLMKYSSEPLLTEKIDLIFLPMTLLSIGM